MTDATVTTAIPLEAILTVLELRTQNLLRKGHGGASQSVTQGIATSEPPMALRTDRHLSPTLFCQDPQKHSH